MIDIEFGKQLTDNEKLVGPMIMEGVINRNNFLTDPSEKPHSKRYSQFIYNKNHNHKLGILVVFLMLLAINLATAATILQYLPTNQAMANNLQSLLAAQNHAVEDYVTLKMELFNHSAITRPKVVSASVDYVENLKQIFASFAPVDDSISDKLNYLVLTDICRLN